MEKIEDNEVKIQNRYLYQNTHGKELNSSTLCISQHWHMTQHRPAVHSIRMLPVLRWNTCHKHSFQRNSVEAPWCDSPWRFLCKSRKTYRRIETTHWTVKTDHHVFSVTAHALWVFQAVWSKLIYYLKWIHNAQYENGLPGSGFLLFA